jgi:hypothetical protein
MKSKTTVVAVLTIAVLSSMFLLNPVNAACNLPASVTLSIGAGDPPVVITLSGIVGSYDIANGPYTGYCVELGTAVGPPPIVATPICTDNEGSPWNEINWLLNNYPDSLNLQLAIWRLQGNSEAFITSQGWTFTAAAGAMYTAALAHGTFDPSAGQWVGVRLVTSGQDLLIKIKVPELAPGFTPGFWKHDIQVRLSHAPYNEDLTKASYNAFSGGPRDGDKLTDALMDTLLATVHTMPGFAALTFDQALANLQLQGNNPLRTATANAFNAAAGYGPYV